MSNLIETSKESLTKKTASKQKKRKTRSATKRTTVSVSVFLIFIVLLIAGSFMLLRGSIKAGASALMNSYSSAYDTERDTAYNKLYQAAFDHAEQNYHVSNTVVISIGNLEESQKLEVLEVNDIEFITEDRDNNTGNVTAWLEVEGKGTFVVDLQAAEYIIDNERQYVLVRVPNPELTNITIIKTTKKLFEDDWMDGSYSEGVNLAIKQRNEAILQIQKSLLSNQYIYSNAKKVAENMIKNLVKQFNPDIPMCLVQ